MERIVKFILVLIILFFCFALPSRAEDSYMNLSTLITAQNINFETCTKVFNIENTRLYYLTIEAINANKFKIDELQSKSGYILFTAVNKQFLATISNVNTNQSMLKIIPVNSNYYFQPGIVLNIYKFIELNIK